MNDIPLAIFAFGLALCAVGAILLQGGWRPRRKGEQPCCRRCGYLLIGIQSQCCPECGARLSPANIVRGQRRRRPGLVWSGAAILLVGAAMLVRVTINGARIIDWYHFKPAFMVMRDLQSGSAAVSNDAIGELSRRESAGSLSSKYEQQLIELVLVQQGAATPVGLTQPLIEFLEQEYVAGHLTDAQKARFGRQCVFLGFLVRPIVVLGERIPYTHDESARVCGTGFHAHIDFAGGPIDIDGKPTGPTGGGSSSMTGLGSGGSSGSSVECSAVGKHQLSMTCLVQLRTGAFDKSSVLFQEKRTFTAGFEVVAKPPPGYFQLINDPATGNLIRASIFPGNFDLGSEDPQTFKGDIKIRAIPVNIAFDMFARFGDREYKIGAIACNKGTSIDYGIRQAIGPLTATTQPSQFDLILRSNEKLSRETIDQHDMWAGELIYLHEPIVRATARTTGF